MSTSSSNLANSNVSLLSNKNEKSNKIQNKIKEQAKLDVFKNLDLDTRGFTDIAKTISEIKEIEKDSNKKIKLNGAISIKYETLRNKTRYKDIFDSYKNVKDDNEKEKMYMEIAERVILDRGGVVEYRDGDKIGKNTITRDFVENEYNILNKEYNGGLDFFTVRDKNGKLHIIKRKSDELKKIEKREDELKNEEIEKLQKENEKLSRDDTRNLEGENNEDSEGQNDENAEAEDKKMKEKDAHIKKLMEDSDNKDKRIAELEKLLKSKDKKSDTESEDTDGETIDGEDDKNNDKLEDSEALDENSNYISRNFVEGLIVGIRGAEGYPKGTIRIREEVINVEEFEFYEEFKQEYIEAKGDATRLSVLDKEFAEMIILFSPKGADYKDRYCIKLSESELKDGLYVSDERLARYGISVKVSEYFEKIVEKEVIRERKIVQKIETEIKELNVIIADLTKKLNGKENDSATILKEIREKRILLAKLVKKQKAILKSLNGPHKTITKIVDDNEKRGGEALYEDFTGKNGEILISYCKTNNIKRMDGKDVDPYSDVVSGNEFIDPRGKILKLVLLEGDSSVDYGTEPKFRLEYTGKKQIEEIEKNSKNRIVVEKFDDSDGGAWFAKYCEENGIKRKDGKKISRKGGMDTSAIYVDKNGKELKLEWIKGAYQHDDTGSHTEYELVYYEEIGDVNELETQLIAIVEEQEALLLELEELEKKLIIAKTSGEKQKIKERIRIINKKLVIITQKITEFESFIQIYKSKVTTRKYSIYHVIPLEIPVPTQGLQLNSVISDMGTDVFREKAALKVEEELKRQYEGLGRWQIGSRLALFLGRGSKRKRMMKNEMNNMANTAFQTDAAYATLNDQSQNAADRHAHELLTAMDAVNRITTVHNTQVDQLCKDYLNNLINDTVFQQRFNAIVAADANIQNALNGQNITHIGTNILLQLKEQRALNVLINTLDTQLNSYIATGIPVYMHNMQNYVEQYIKDYQKLPAFRTTFEQFLQGNLNARNQLRRYLSHQKAIMNMQITNLRMNIDILNNGKSAYQIDNKDREKGWKYKVGRFMDKHPRGTAIGTVALSVGLGVATAPLSAVAGAAITTGVFGSYVGFTNYIKKWTHHTKEQNTHEKNVVTDYRNEQAKIQNWQNLALNGRGRKKYKAKRQLALYNQTTQENIQLSNQITEYITNLSAKVGPLTANEDNFMKLNLIEGWARLKYYREIGHNFLASENADKTEKDMRRLEKAITLGLQKIGQNTNDIENGMTATNGLGTNITYDVIKNDLKASYDKSLIQFKRERRWLALRYGIGTAALSIGTALGLQWLTRSGVFAKDIPGTPGTPGTPSSTTSHAGGTDNFALGKYDISGTLGSADSGNVYTTTKSVVAGAPTGSTVNFTYGVGTDATHVIPGHLTSTDLATQIASVKANIGAMSRPTTAAQAQRDAFLTELKSLASSGFTNDNLATMRAAEYLEHCAQAMSDAGMANSNVWSLTPTFSRALDVSGGTYNNLAERFMTGAIDVTTPAIPGTSGTPGVPAKTLGRWLMGTPLFFNTFKKRKSSKDTTDQNFGSNAQGNP